MYIEGCLLYTIVKNIVFFFISKPKQCSVVYVIDMSHLNMSRNCSTLFFGHTCFTRSPPVFLYTQSDINNLNIWHILFLNFVTLQNDSWGKYTTDTTQFSWWTKMLYHIFGHTHYVPLRRSNLHFHSKFFANFSNLSTPIIIYRSVIKLTIEELRAR